MAPSLVGGPQDCNGSWSPQFIIDLLCFCICFLSSCVFFVCFFMISRCRNFRMFLVIPGRHQVCVLFFPFKCLEGVLLRTTAPITLKLCRHVSQPFDVDVLLFLQHVATHSHSHPLAISNFIWADPPLECQMKSTHFSTQIRCSHWIPKSQAQCINFFHILALSRSFAPNFFFCRTDCCIVNETPEDPGCRLELESLGRHVG